jgi:hypothetical protein
MQFDDGPDRGCFQSPRNPSNSAISARPFPGAFCAATSPVTTVAEDRDLVGAYNDLLLQRLASKSVRPSAIPAVSVGFGSGGGMLQAGWRF